MNDDPHAEEAGAPWQNGRAADELSVGELRSRAVHGVKALVLVQVLKIAGSIILARVLVPEIFGLFAIASVIVNVAALFGELGLSAALIRREDEPAPDDLAAVFTIQCVSSLALCALIFAAAPLLLAIYPDSVAEVTWLLRVLGLTLVFSCLRTVPIVRLERKLLFGKISMIETGEAVVFQVTAVVLALCGLEAWSLVIAMLLRGIAGVVLANVLSPWRPALSTRLAPAGKLLRFGLPYQGTHVLSLINAAIAPILLGVIVRPDPAIAIGYITFATTHALRPQLLLEIVGRVAFPAYARLQQNKDLLKTAIEKSAAVLSKIILPFVAVALGLAPQIVAIVFTDKWLPTVPVLYLYLAAMVVIVPLIIQMRSLTALGHANVLFKYSILTTALNWIIAVPLCSCLESRFGKGFIGIGVVFVVGNVIGTTWTLLYLRRIIKVRMLRSMAVPFAAAAASGGLCYAASAWVGGLLSLGLVAAAAFAVYAAILLIVQGRAGFDFTSELLKRS